MSEEAKQWDGELLERLIDDGTGGLQLHEASVGSILWRVGEGRLLMCGSETMWVGMVVVNREQATNAKVISSATTTAAKQEIRSAKRQNMANGIIAVEVEILASPP